MAKKSFIKGAAILGAAGIVIKILGAFFRIPEWDIIKRHIRFMFYF